jgi:hypothetical protein
LHQHVWEAALDLIVCTVCGISTSIDSGDWYDRHSEAGLALAEFIMKGLHWTTISRRKRRTPTVTLKGTCTVTLKALNRDLKDLNRYLEGIEDVVPEQHEGHFTQRFPHSLVQSV